MIPPSDLELMMLLDGELESDRRAEVEAFLASRGGAEATGKLAGLQAVSAVVTRQAAWPRWEALDGEVDHAEVAANVMRALGEAVAEPRTSAAVAPELPRGASRTPSAAEPARALGAGGSARAAAPAAGGRAPKAANDNGKLIFGLALAAAAAAAALFFWGKSPAPLEPLAARTASAPAEAPEVPVTAKAPSPAPVVAEEEAEPRYGVEVASVDFGGRSGAIYYVPSIGDGAPDPSAAAVTTVVWLSDD